MELSKQEIQHIAELARLELTDKELELYGKQLPAILDFVNELQDVDTDGVEPTAQVTGLVNVLREDKVKEWEEVEKRAALEQAPELEGGQVKVRRVL